MSIRQLHQVVNTLLPGDATSDDTLLIRRWLRELGLASEIYTLSSHPDLEHEVLTFSIDTLRNEKAIVFHHTMGSQALEELVAAKVPLILVYHNITPPHFYLDSDPVMADELHRGRMQLEKTRPVTRLALCNSPYTEIELRSVGFENTGVLPIVLDEFYLDIEVDETLFRSSRQKRPLLLFVGRIAPNKRQEDLIKLLYYYRRIEPSAHLILVGSTRDSEYVSWLRNLAENMGLQDAVILTGHVSQQEMVTYYRAADIFISMSEHEGFGKPLIESMYLGVPIMAYASTAVPSTLGGAGVLFREKNFEALAEMVDMAVSDSKLRARLIAGQTRRVQAFLERNVRRQWHAYLASLGLLPAARPLVETEKDKAKM